MPDRNVPSEDSLSQLLSVPSTARIYDYLLGGKDHFLVDRTAGDAILEVEPGARAAALQNRAFLGRAVRYLSRDAGICQFLDIGSGLPTAENVHEVAQRSAPEARVVYVDNDPIVLAHARALMTSGSAGHCEYVDADLRDTEKILSAARKTLDFSRPVAVMLIAVLHFIADADDPAGITERLMDAVPPGSFLAVSHVTAPAESAGKTRGIDGVYAETPAGGVHPRGLDQVSGLFGSLEPVDPGVVSIEEWRPDKEPGPGPVIFYGGVSRKPAG